jgi:hypothetical protein
MQIYLNLSFFYASFNNLPSPFASNMNRGEERGHACLRPLYGIKKWDATPLIHATNDTYVMQLITHTTNLGQKPKCTRINLR